MNCSPALAADNASAMEMEVGGEVVGRWPRIFQVKP